MNNHKQITNFDRYKVVPRTLIFIFNKNNNVLLIKGSQSKQLFGGLYNGIGGHVELGEDILEAAKRELKEEVGIGEISLDICGQIMIDVTRELGVALFVFRGFYNGKEIQTSTEGECEWIPISELSKKPVVEDLPVLIPEILAYQQSDPIIIGKYRSDASGNRAIFFSE